MKLSEAAPGDIVTRLLAGTIPMDLRVTAVDARFIYCGPVGSGWKFDRSSGAEWTRNSAGGRSSGRRDPICSAVRRRQAKPGPARELILDL